MIACLIMSLTSFILRQIALHYSALAAHPLHCSMLLTLCCASVASQKDLPGKAEDFSCGSYKGDTEQSEAILVRNAVEIPAVSQRHGARGIMALHILPLLTQRYLTGSRSWM